MKFELLRKRIILEAIIVSIALIVAIALGWMASDWHEDTEQESRSIKRSLATTSKRLDTINAKYENSRQSLDIYQMIKQRQQSGGLELSRKYASTLLNRLKNKYKLTHLSLSMSPVSQISQKEFTRKNAQIVRSDVTLKFSGISDSQIFSFLQELQIELGGYLRITSMNLERMREIDEKALRLLGKGTMPELVKGDMSLQWLGLRKTEKADNG